MAAELSVFDFEDYKAFLKAKLSAKDSEWGSISRAASAAGCQRTYLSRVINGSAHLSSDQAFQLAQWWRLPTLDRGYFLSLVEYARSSQKDFKKFLEQRLSRLRAESRNLARKISGKTLDISVNSIEYFSSWMLQAAHLLCATDSKNTVSEISRRLSQPEKKIRSALEKLQSQGLISQHEGKWRFESGDLFLARNSPLTRINHTTWRNRAIEVLQLQESEDFHYSNLQLMSKTAAEKILKLLRELVIEADQVASPSESEEIYCMNLDFFSP